MARLRNEEGIYVDASIDLNNCVGNENGMLNFIILATHELPVYDYNP